MCKNPFLVKRHCFNKRRFCSPKCANQNLNKRFKHGFGSRDYTSTKRRFYNRWSNMNTRCFNKNRTDWKNYGGRGITICKRWFDFKNFKEDMYDSFLKHLEKNGFKNTTLDRLDVNKDYCKKNCRWATKEQQRENSRDAVFINYKGKKYRMKELAKIFGRTRDVIKSRIYKHIPLDQPYKR